MDTYFSIKKVVTSKDIDTLNHVNNVVYVKWMEEIATEHWQYLTRENPLPQYVWVVLRHEIDYYNQAILGDTVVLKTKVGETRGFKSERIIEIFNKDVLIVKSKTIWGMLDAKTFKPSRIRENVLKILHANK